MMQYTHTYLLLLLIIFINSCSSTTTEVNSNANETPVDVGNTPIDSSNDELTAKISLYENPNFTEEKCTSYWSYFENNENFTDDDCKSDSGLIQLSEGFAPLGVFFRGAQTRDPDSLANLQGRVCFANSTALDDTIVDYQWQIIGPIETNGTGNVIAELHAFNFAYIFEEPGTYTVKLTITDDTGKKGTAEEVVNVWPRNGNTYYVDSSIGDDRFDGLSQQAESNCEPQTEVVGNCSGPWKTATRAFGELSPFESDMPNGKYSASSICDISSEVLVESYNQGEFKLFRSSTSVDEEKLVDDNGIILPPYTVKVCSQLKSKRDSVLKPGDEVLFKRGLAYDLETAYGEIVSYQVESQGTVYDYERLDSVSLVSTPHWSPAIGVSFSSYGDGEKPLIQNTGALSNTVIHLLGVGMFNLSFTDLKFDLESSNAINTADRATFINSPGHLQNLIVNRVDLQNMNQGLILEGVSFSQGLYIFESTFFDSYITQLFTGHSFSDVAIINNNFDFSDNHLAYTSIDFGLVTGNIFSRPSFGRTAYRLYGGLFEDPNRNIWISDNSFSGWVDPIDRQGGEGDRYNFLLVHLGPNNADTTKAINNVVFKNNTIKDAEVLLGIGVVDGLAILDNEFSTLDGSSSDRVVINQKLSRRPSRNILIQGNNFIELGDGAPAGQTPPTMNLRDYTQEACVDQENNENINILDNNFYNLQNRRVLSITSENQTESNFDLDSLQMTLQDTVTFNGNKLFTSLSDFLSIQVGGDSHTLSHSDDFSESIGYYTGISELNLQYRIYPQFFDQNDQNYMHVLNEPLPESLQEILDLINS